MVTNITYTVYEMVRSEHQGDSTDETVDNNGLKIKVIILKVHDTAFQSEEALESKVSLNKRNHTMDNFKWTFTSNNLYDMEQGRGRTLCDAWHFLCI